MVHIAFIGAGASTTISLINLVNAMNSSSAYHGIDRISIVEKSKTPGVGLAYSTNEPCHLFNSRANKIGIVSGQDDHFFKWLHAQPDKWQYSFPQITLDDITSDSFIPRAIYGHYLKDMFDLAINNARQNGITVNVIEGDAVGATEINQKGLIKIKMKNSATTLIEADKIVIAVGNPPPPDLPFLKGCRHYISSFWTEEGTNIPLHAPITIIGTGLTSVDALLTLQARGHKGKITLLSRNGKLPEVHQDIPSHPYLRKTITVERAKALGEQFTADAYFTMLQEEIANAAAHKINWRAVIDSLRNKEDATTLWRILGEKEQQKWDKLYGATYNVLRFRMPSDSWERISPLLKSGQVTVKHMKADNTSFQMDADTYYINCAGHSLRQSPFMQTLFDQGTCVPHPSSGIRISDDMQVIRADKRPSDVFFGIGPLRRGEDFEAVAIIEIVKQSEKLVQNLIMVKEHDISHRVPYIEIRSRL